MEAGPSPTQGGFAEVDAGFHRPTGDVSGPNGFCLEVDLSKDRRRSQPGPPTGTEVVGRLPDAHWLSLPHQAHRVLSFHADLDSSTGPKWPSSNSITSLGALQVSASLKASGHDLTVLPSHSARP